MKSYLVLHIVFIAIFIALPVYAEQQQYVMGNEDNWRDIQSAENIQLQQGRKGYLDIMLDTSEYRLSQAPTDGLLHFDALPLSDAAGQYEITHEGDVSITDSSRIGSGAAGFNAGTGGIKLRPAGKMSLDRPLFQAGRLWQDFSIEFWLRPKFLETGEVVLRWNGQRSLHNDLELQELSCYIEDRRLVWNFDNFFLHPEQEAVLISLSGRSRLIPQQWSHHLVRYDAESGLIEYVVNGVTEAVAYARDEASEKKTVLKPYIGERNAAPLKLAPEFSGLMDEFRITRHFIQDPKVQRYPKEGGRVVIGPLELEEAGSQLLKIDVSSAAPGDGDIFFYYRLAQNRYNFDLEDPEWKNFRPGEELDESAQGAYVQIMYELFPDGTGMKSPKVFNTTVTYRPNLPPPAPVAFSASPRNGAVALSWGGIQQRDLGGYLLYFGTSPGVYRGTGSSEGPSPIDLGNRTSVVLENLENGKLYYFAVAAYDTSGPSHRSSLSNEVTARPSNYYGD